MKSKGGGQSRDAERAIETYERFHRYAPKNIGEFHKSFAIPSSLVNLGRGKWVTYRSGKVDPATLKKPRGTVDYIHEFDSGVNVYVPGSNKKATLKTPSEFVEADALTLLGTCLGFCYKDRGDDNNARRDLGIEVAATAPYPELYTVASGRCLVVVQSKREVLALIYGGSLGVFARGIDG